jgi:hypothetical protein
MLARLLIPAGDPKRASEFAKSAYRSKHQCPADILVYALALEAAGNRAEAARICEEAIRVNDEMEGVQELRDRLAGDA